MRNNIRCVVSIAGSDPSGGAGIQADIKAISATGSYAASIITALTAQNTQGVQAIQEVPPEFVTQQLTSVFSDLNIHAVKIGMLHNESVIHAVTHALLNYKPPHIVCDPVMVAKNGCALLPLSTLQCLKDILFPHVHLITPNLFEAENLVGNTIQSASDMEAAAIQLGDIWHTHVLVKGGHLMTAQSSDVLYDNDTRSLHWFHGERIPSNNTHGTGCSLSSAIASFLAQGYPVSSAIQRAKQYLTRAIQASAAQHIGQGIGPVDHFYYLQESLHDIPCHA